MKQDIHNTYFPILKKHYPELREEEVTFYGDGYDHYVFVVNHKHAFRFPRSSEHGKQDHIINEFSQTFAPDSPVPIQRITGHVDSETGMRYQTYEFIKGVPFTKEMAKALPESELVMIAKDMGKFLSALHAFPIEEAKSMGMESLISPRDYADYFIDVIELDKKLIYHLLTKSEWEWFEKRVHDFAKLSYEHPYTFTVTHSDILPEHILIDEQTHRLSGIIDFTLRIADPANDFKYFDRYGEAFLRTVYENYLPVDEYFDLRRKFYAGDLPVANLYLSVQRNDDKQTQEKFVKELKAYIASDILSS